MRTTKRVGDLSRGVVRAGISIVGDAGAYSKAGHSHQIIGPDLILNPGAGSSDPTDPKFLATVMGNILLMEPVDSFSETFVADATANAITITGHGLANGDGPFELIAGSGVLPGGTSADTPYWVIVIDENTIALAESKADTGPTHRLGDDCILCLPLRANANDVGPNGFTVTNHGTVTFDPDDGAGWNGTDKYLSLAADPLLEPADTSITFAWSMEQGDFDEMGSNVQGGFGFAVPGDTGSWQVFIDWAGGDNYRIQFFTGDPFYAGFSSGYDFDPAVRYYFAVVMNNELGKAQLWVNGALDTEDDYPEGYTGLPRFNTQLDIGRIVYGATVYNRGSSADFLYANRPFYANDALAHYNGGSGHSDGGLNVEVSEGTGVDLSTAGTTHATRLMERSARMIGAGNYLAGVIGAYSITGEDASEYPTAGVIGLLFDGAQADAMVLAVLDGDDGGSPTNARAFFGIAVNNNNASSGADYGLDLYAASNAHYSGGGLTGMEAITVAAIRFPNGQVLATLDTAITADSTLTDLPAGSLGITSHATGVGKLFMSDGAKWQYAAVA